MSTDRPPAQTSAPPLTRAQRRALRSALVAALRRAGQFAAVPVVDLVLGTPQALTSDEAAALLQRLGAKLWLARQLRRLRAAGGEGVHEVDAEGRIGEACARPVASVRVTEAGFYVAALSEDPQARTATAAEDDARKVESA